MQNLRLSAASVRPATATRPRAPRRLLRRASLLAALPLVGAFAASSRAEDRSSWREFVIPTLSTEATAGSPIDLSHLSPEPAGSNGRLRADGDRVIDAEGNTVRLFGTNICDWHVTPPKEFAEPIARRLQQLGVNYIRLHYYDYVFEPRALLAENLEDFDPEQLDELDWLVFQLKQAGIYVDLNLHCARQLDGLPDGWQEWGKGLNRISPQLIEDQKAFTRRLLTHVNAYTGMTYAEDPAIAAMEISNENSTMLEWESTHRHRYAALPDDLREPIQAAWNAWLLEKHGDDAALAAAWEPEPVRRGPELLDAETFGPRLGGLPPAWATEARNGGRSDTEVVATAGVPAALRWTIHEPGTQSWSHQLHQGGLDVEAGEPYVIRLRARAHAEGGGPVPLKVSLMHEVTPWQHLIGPETIELTGEWQDFTFGGHLDDPAGRGVRLTIDPDNTAGVVEFAGVSVRRDQPPTERLGGKPSEGTVPLVTATAPQAAQADFDRFVAEADLAFGAEMTRFLKEDLGYEGLVWDSQAAYGGAVGLAREARNSDATDMHQYPDHPSGDSNARDDQGRWKWSVQQKSLVGAAAGAAEEVAFYRVAGKPMFVSEWDLNPPNDHAAESYPLFTMLAAVQGWTGLNEYSWLNFQEGYEHDRINSSYATTGHAGQMSTIPFSALLFRLGLLDEAEGRTTLTVHEESLLDGRWGYALSAMNPVWQDRGVESFDAWRSRLAVEVKPGAGPTSVSGVPDRSVRDADSGQQVVLYRDAEGEPTHMTAIAPAARAALGTIGGETIELGDLTLEVEAGTMREYASLYLATLDGRPVAETDAALATVVARVENAGMEFSDDRATVGYDYGHGPTLAEPVHAKLTLPGGGWTAHRLDGTGRPVEELPVEDGRVVDTADAPGVWFLLRRAD